MTFPPVRFYNSLAAQLLRVIFGLYLVVTIIVTTVQLSAEYHHVKEEISKELEKLPNTFGPGIKESLWEFNLPLLQSILIGMHEMSIITGVRIINENEHEILSIGWVLDDQGRMILVEQPSKKRIFIERKGLFSNLFGFNFLITHTDEKGKLYQIGQVTIYSSEQIVFERVKYGFTLIVINSVIKTLTLWGLFLIFLRSMLTHPLNDFVTTLEKVNLESLGEVIVRIKTTGRNELKVLEESFNSMIEKLRKALDERKKMEQNLRKHEEHLEEIVHERTEELETSNEKLRDTLEELRATQEQLIESETMASLGQLVAGIAHEINTPLGIGITSSSLQKKLVEEIKTSYAAQSMTRKNFETFLTRVEEGESMTLDNLLRVADLVRSFKEIAVDHSYNHPTKLLLRQHLEMTVSMLQPQLGEINPNILIDCDQTLEVVVDSIAITQVISNLVMNAVEHAFDPMHQGHIRICVTTQAKWTVLQCIDNGKGIPEENLKKIFTPFFTTARSQGHVGLGLHISYNLVTQKLGGSIRCHSKIEEGTCFTIKIPNQ